MKKVTVKKSVLASAILLAAGYIGSAQAHCLDTQSITTNSTSAFQQDVYMVSCPTGTQSLQGFLSLKSGTGVSYQIGKGGYSGWTTGTNIQNPSVSDTTALSTSACAVDPLTGKEYIATGVTSAINLNGNAGIYTLLVSKDTATTSAYAIEFHCMSGLNGTGTEYMGVTPALGTWEQGGPLSADATGHNDALDTAGSFGNNTAASDTNHDVNLVINH